MINPIFDTSYQKKESFSDTRVKAFKPLFDLCKLDESNFIQSDQRLFLSFDEATLYHHQARLASILLSCLMVKTAPALPLKGNLAKVDEELPVTHQQQLDIAPEILNDPYLQTPINPHLIARINSITKEWSMLKTLKFFSTNPQMDQRVKDSVILNIDRIKNFFSKQDPFFTPSFEDLLIVFFPTYKKKIDLIFDRLFPQSTEIAFFDEREIPYAARPWSVETTPISSPLNRSDQPTLVRFNFTPLGFIKE